MVCDVHNGELREVFEKKSDRDWLRSLSAKSFIAVPLRTHDRVLGAIVMINTSPGRICGADELSLAEELAHRAALALDNAGLYKSAQTARAEAERANRAKDSFLAMLSHELRTPLTPVLTSVLALEQGNDLSDDMRAALQMIRRNVQLEARLIDDLLDLTRISKGKVQLNLEEVDAHLLLRSALEICEADIAKKKLVLQTEFAAERPALLADPARLQQIFWNLIKNAVKFTPEGGRLEIRTENRDGELCVCVSDAGIGIDAETLPKIFNAFEQGERMQFGPRSAVHIAPNPFAEPSRTHPYFIGRSETGVADAVRDELGGKKLSDPKLLVGKLQVRERTPNQRRDFGRRGKVQIQGARLVRCRGLLLRVHRYESSRLPRLQPGGVPVHRLHRPVLRVR
jgi:hypothetical protein